MEISDIRKKLMEYIENADERKLEAMYIILESEIEAQHTYSPEELNILNDRREQYLSGKTKGYSVEEALDMVRKSKK